MRELKYHEKKLLKKVNFLTWESTNTTREQIVTGKYLLKSREEYKEYNVIVGMIRKLAETLARLAANNPAKVHVEKKLLGLLFEIGIIGEKKMSICTKITVSDICKRRLPMVMAHRKMAPSYTDADRLVQQGHVRLGPRLMNSTNTLISKSMEEFVAWVDNSKIKKQIDEFNCEYDDYKYN